jgi:peptidoglycan/xylan/chitin deacetylase (PgdA/CDA1 family)
MRCEDAEIAAERRLMRLLLPAEEASKCVRAGPWPKNTPAALAAHCTKAIFFPIGLHATYEPSILKQVAAAGHAIGSHTWCHQDLSKTKGKCNVNGKTETVEYDPKDEIEKGVSAVRWAVGGPTAPYFRFPALRQPQELVDYLGKRNIAIFSADMDSFDFKMRKPEQVRQSVMAKLQKHGKGIVLLHDFQHATAGPQWTFSTISRPAATRSSSCSRSSR